MPSKSRTLYKIKAMAKGKPFDFDKALAYAVFNDDEYELAIITLAKVLANGNKAFNYHLITEITTQVLVE